MIRFGRLPSATLIAFFIAIFISSHLSAQPAAMTPAEEKLVDRFLRAYETNDPKLLTSIIDVAEYTKLVRRRMPIEHRNRLGDLKPALEKFGRNMLEMVPSDLTLNFLRVKDSNGIRRLQFRTFGSFGLNYLELILVDANGATVCADIWIANLGESLSESLARVESAKFSDKDGVRKVEAERRIVAQVLRALQAREFENALELYDSLNLMKDDRLALTMRLQAAAMIGGDTLAQVKKSLETRYGRSVAWSMTLVSTFMSKGEYNAAIECITEIENALGPDGYLSFLKGDCAWSDSDPTMAKYYLIQSLDFEPGLFVSVSYLLEISLQEKNYRDTRRWLIFIERNFQAAFAQDLESPEFADFKKSPEYLQWMKERPSLIEAAR